MDWSKAKNVLIVAFIITNILLAYVIQKDLPIKDNFQINNDKYMENVENYLLDRGIEVDLDIPNKNMTLPILMVRYKTFDMEEVAQTFLGKNYNIIDKDIYKSGNKKLERVSNKKFIYTDSSRVQGNYPLDEDKVVEISKKFLKDHKLLAEDLELQQIYLGPMKEYGVQALYKLVYNQVYKGQFLAESYINVYIKHKQVVGLEVMLLEYEKTQGEKKKIIPATEALLRKMNDILTDNVEEDKIVISDIELGYYFNTSGINLTNWDTIASGTAFPSWKIVLANGRTYYVEALKN